LAHFGVRSADLNTLLRGGKELPSELLMSAENPPDPSSRLEQLKEEISRLTQQQENALRIAVYVGMSEREADEYDRRHSNINALIQQLRGLLGKPESLV